jgi:hypothetical protein
MKANSIKNLSLKSLAGFASLKVVFVILFLSIWGFSSAQTKYIWYTPNGRDTLLQNKTVLLVQLDANSFGSTLLNIISHRPEIDSIYYSHHRSDTAKKQYVVSLVSGISDSLFHRAIVLLDTCSAILKVCEVLGDTGQFLTTSTIIVRLLNRADSTILKNRLISHSCNVYKIYQYDSLIWFANVNNPDSNSIQISRKLHESGLFEYAEPNLAFFGINTSTTNDPKLSSQWYLNNTGANHLNIPGCSGGGEDISAYAAWDITTGCQYQKIAILDDGVWPTHTDLDCVNYGFNALLLDPFYQYIIDYIDSSGIPDDSSHKHGTRCAGIATAKGDNNIGIAGVAYDTRVVSIKFQSLSLKSSCIALAAAYDIAENIGADVVSGSFAIYNNSQVPTYPYQSYLVTARIQHLAEHGRNGLGIPMVHSTGNGGFSSLCQTGIPIVGFPANDTNTIAVTDCDNLVTDANFSYCADYGGTTFLAAPGVEVLTTNVVFFGGPYWNYEYFEGTSAAAPIVAGTVGLILAANPMLNYRQVKNILANSADKVTYTYNNTYIADHPWSDWSPEFGYGRVNAYNAADMARNTKFLLYSKMNGIVSELPGPSLVVQSGDLLTYKLRVNISDNLVPYVTIAWYRNGVPIDETTAEIHPEMRGIYMAKIVNPCNGMTVYSQDLEVTYACAISNNYSNTTITTSPLSGLVYNMNGTIHIGGNVTFTDCIIMMKSGSQIIIDPGNTLTLNNTDITSCDQWTGVRVQYSNPNRGFLDIDNSSISKAIVGVMLENGGKIIADNSRFEDNEMHLAFDAYGSNHMSQINDCKFGMLSDVSGNSHPHSISNTLTCMVYADQVTDITFDDNTFLSIDPFGLTNPTDMEFYGVIDATIDGNTFGTDNYYSLYLIDCHSTDILYNYFAYKNEPVTAVPGGSYDYNAIYTKDCESLTINHNSFLGCTEGLQFYQNLISPGTTEISKNLFLYNNNALIISPIEHPLYGAYGANENCSTYVYMMQIDIFCNTFEENTAAILGSGDLQNPSTLQGTGNDFNSNVDWDLLWKDCSGWAVYNEYRTTVPPNPFIPYPNTSTINNPNPAYTLNGVSISVPEIIFDHSTSNINCAALSTTLTTENSILKTSTSFVAAYPNPFNSLTVFENHSGEITKCIIYDILGNKIEEFTLDKNSKKEIDMSGFASGVYVLKTDLGSKIKLIKTN